MKQIIKTHKELATHIAGKKVLLMNSLGKDSIVCLEWLHNYAHVAEIHSLFFEFIASHPDDERYISYLKKRYPRAVFHKEPNAIELSNVCAGIYQQPLRVMNFCNHLELNDFEMKLQAKEIKEKLGCDFICQGQSKYESFARATKFHQKGILVGDEIFPLGMMTKDQVMGVIKSSGMKLHPQYKTTPSTYDHPSYWKMRSGFIVNPEFQRRVFELYPLMRLDKYRHERMLK